MDTLPNITVGIVKNKTINFFLSGKFNIIDTEEYFYGAYEVQLEKNNLIIFNSDKKNTFKNEVVLLPSNISSDYFELKDVIIGKEFHWEQKEDEKFQGALKLTIVNNRISVINIIPIENYLVSVISSEMNAKSSINLLKAHAIISRSWIIAQMEKQKSNTINKEHHKIVGHTVGEKEFINWYDRDDHKNYVVCADDHCQRYQGITRTHNPNVIKAISETVGQVLKYNNEICDTRFSKSCGGVTEDYKNCWEPVSYPYLTKVIDSDNNNDVSNLTIENNAVKWINSNPVSFCNTSDKKVLSQILNDYDVNTGSSFRWEIKYTQQELSEIINKKSDIDFGQIIDLVPMQRGESARLVTLKIIGTKKTLIIGKELEIRKWLSKSHLYSSAITIEKQNVKNNIPEGFVIKGAGWGHGVGLCQIGAAVMADKGYTYIKILNHYYKNAVIERFY